MPVHEEAIVFGSTASLVGVLTRPEGGGRSGVACVIPNAGLIYRIGPRRISVKLARALGEAGVPTLRFDLAGVGDSKQVGDSAPARQRILGNMRDALDELERATGIRRFIIVGVCSGAVNGFRTALDDERVVGVLMYDGFWYRSRWTGLVRLAKRLVALRPAEIGASLARRWRELTAPRADVAGGLADFDAANPPLHEFVEQVDRLVGRGVKLCFVYGGGVLRYYSYAGQFKDVFGAQPFFAQVRCDFLPSLDHMLSSAEAQRTMQALVVRWATEVAAATPEPAAAGSAAAVEAEPGVCAE